jgi:iron complex outermembrane receptor protein
MAVTARVLGIQQTPIRAIAKVSLLASAAFVAMAALSSTAHAQAAAPNDEVGTVETVIVTAQRREQSRQDVPASVSAITAAELAQIGVTRMDDLRFSVPGLNVHWSESMLSSRTNIRGIQEGATVSSADQPVAYYLDDVYLGSRLSTNFDLFDAERIEVLRGPQGTLFGRNAVGGVISVTTKEPTQDFEADFSGTIGSQNEHRIQGSVSGPIAPTLSARLSAVYTHRDGDMKDSISGDTLGDYGVAGVRGKLLWQPNDSFKLQFSADYSKLIDSGGDVFDVLADRGLLPALGAVPDKSPYDRRVALGRIPEQHFHGGGASIHATYDFGDISLISISGYRTYKFQTDQDAEASSLDFVDNTTSERLRAFTQEIRLQSDGDKRFDWMVGAFYMKQKTQLSDIVYVRQDLADLFGADAGFSDSRPTTDTQSFSIFAHGDYDFTDKLNLAVGVRATWDTKDFQTEQESTFFLLDTVPRTTSSQSWDAITPSASLSYKWTPDVMTYATIARGYKSGAINDTVLPGTGLVPVAPEYLWNYELGLKSVWFDRRLLVNAAIFTMQWTDIQFTQFVPVNNVPTLLVGNVDKAHSNGFELEVQGWITPQWKVTSAYTLLDANYDAPSDSFSAGQRFLRTPKHALNLATEYDVPLSGDWNLRFRGDYTYQSEMQYTFAKPPPAYTGPLTNHDLSYGDAYSLFGARVTLTAPQNRWSISVWGKNLTDENYTTNLSDSLASLVIGRRAFIRLGPPRTYGIDLSVHF